MQQTQCLCTSHATAKGESTVLGAWQVDEEHVRVLPSQGLADPGTTPWVEEVQGREGEGLRRNIDNRPAPPSVSKSLRQCNVRCWCGHVQVDAQPLRQATNEIAEHDLRSREDLAVRVGQNLDRPQPKAVTRARMLQTSRLRTYLDRREPAGARFERRLN